MAWKWKISELEYTILISEVQSRQCLWNDRHKDFKNGAITKKMWREIGKILNIPGEECKKKWKNLKDTYRKKVRTPDGNNTWKYSKLMEFTLDLISPNPVLGNASLPIGVGDSITYTDIIENQDDIPDHGQQQDTMSSTPEDDEQFFRPQCSFRNMRRSDDLERRFLELEERKIEAILNLAKENDEEKSEDYHFFLSLLPFVAGLGDLEKLELRTKIQNCVLEAVKEHNLRLKTQQFSQTNCVYDSPPNSSLDQGQSETNGS